ncbi:MAG: S8 family serine peptidase [Terrimonas sp.]|nr:S8 family serine peptidase [Terrimonas sp.]
MKKNFAVLLGSFMCCFAAKAQYNRHIIAFRDKAGSPYSFNNPSAFLSQRAIDRRARYAIPIDSTDLPITPRYLDSIRAVPNVSVLVASKWLNQVAIETSDPAALVKIQSFPFVNTVNAVAPRLNPAGGRTNDKFGKETITPFAQGLSARTEETTVSYGQTYNQVHIHNGEFLHDRGFQGQGMVIAVLDGGFSSYKTNPAFDSARLNNQIYGEWNFVNNQRNTDTLSGHGMNCFSTIAANRPGSMVGTSPYSGYWLLITEDVNSEYPIEEHFWACGAEYADSVGADLISSSLGYQDFDDPSFDHLYAERDGKSTMITKAANMAARKGIIVMNSAGNYGTDPTQKKYISCPADGDSVIAVGAVSPLGNIASFSSWGPNSAGKVKPNVVSVGQGTVIANSLGNPVSGNGTSFANPNMAGLVSCLWQAFPEYNNMKIMDALQRSASRYNNPDDRFGYGIPNMRTAYYLLKSDRSRQQFGSNGWFRATPDPFAGQIDASFIADNSGNITLYLKNALGNRLDSMIFNCDSLDYKTYQFTGLDNLPGGVYFIQYKSATKDSSIALSKQTSLFDNDWIRVFPNPFDQDFFVSFKAQVNGKADIRLFDIQGKLLESKREFSIQKDNIYNITIDGVKKISGGTYILIFDDGTNKRSLKIIRN